MTASELADLLGLTPAAVRRHLDGLTAAGLIAEGHAPHVPRGRGRPARHFVLTAAGHAAGATGYDDLAVAALTYLQESGGDAAVRRFADARVSEWESRYRDVVQAAGPDSARRAEALAAALTDDGYAATTRPVEVGDPTSEAGITSLGTQLCQGHCPVQRVAAQFPQLCEAETEAFARLLGRARPAAGHDGPRRARLHHPRPARPSRPADQSTSHQHRQSQSRRGRRDDHRHAHPELDGLGRYEYGWADTDVAGATARRGPVRGRRARTSRR